MSALFFLGVCVLSLHSGCVAQDSTYLITSPRLLRLDAVEKVVVQVFHEQDTSVQLYLKKSLAAGDTLYASETVQLNAGNSYQAAANMRIFSKDFPADATHVYLHAVASGINQHERIPVTRDNGFLFIQTDKPLYTPEQSVKVRVFSLSEELKPARRKVTLTFQDPEAVRVDIVDLVDVSGIISMQRPFKIPLKPKLGVWKIKASYTNDFSTIASTTFEVKEYVLPSIIVTLQPEQTYISEANMESFQLTVTARYAHGAPVQDGYVGSKFGYITEQDTVILPKSFRTVQLTDGNVELNLNIRQALADAKDGPQDLQQLEGTHLYVIITVVESTGGIRQQAELATVKFVASPFSLSLIATPLFIKPALPYTVKALVKDPMGNPVGGVPVNIRASATDESGQELYTRQEQESTTESDGNGKAVFTFNIPSSSNKAEFFMETADKRLPAHSQATFKFKADSYVSTRGRYLYIDLPHSTVEVNNYMSISVYFYYRHYLTLKSFSYQVLSKGKVVKHVTLPRRGELMEVINLKVTPEMVPSARLIVYFIQTGEGAAELVADSVWFDVQDKCMNGLSVALSVPKSEYKPKDELALQLKTSQSSVVALAAVDTALYALRLKHTDPLNTVLRHIEKKDMGCGGGGGKDAADVFRRAGLMFMTNANAKAIIEGDTCSDAVRPKRAVTEEDCKKIITTYPRLKSYCEAGLKNYATLESCETRANRLFSKGHPNAVRAFRCCCELAAEMSKNTGGYTLARAAIEAMLDNIPMQIRSYFPESWLWEEHQTHGGPDATVLKRMLPDSLTTWEMRAVSLSNDGICVSEPVRLSVSQAVSVDVPLPYSMVRGEQVELRGSVYNQNYESSQFSVTLDSSEGICVFRGQNSEKNNQGVLGENSVTFIHFYIMALETGTHTLNFTLNTIWGKERLVKTLRVTPEGILTEDNTGATIDPQGIYGTSKRRVELRNSLPPKVVPNSPVERRLTVTGEFLGEVLAIMNDPKGLQTLVNLPRGSAEKELMGLLPLYYVYHYIETGNNWASLGPQATDIKSDLKSKMKEGLVSIMSFKTRLQDAFSMWKNREASTWLTALMVKTLALVNKYTEVDGNEISKCIYWLINNCQRADGSFIETSSYKPTKLMGAGADATEQAVYLTSFVVIGIKNAMEIPECKLELFEEALKKAQNFLFDNGNSRKLKSLYVQAVTAYALTLVDSSSIPSLTLLEELKKKASVNGNPPVIRFWQDESAPVNPLKPHKASAQMVETTVYVLLTALLRGHATYIKPILTWLTQDQRYGGGFYSTQDTILTLEALSKYSTMNKDSNLNMGITAAYRTKGDLDFIMLTASRPIGKRITVTKNDDIILSTGLSTGVSVANLKTVYYKMVDDSSNCNFDISIELKPHNPKSNNYMELLPRIIACARYKPAENEVYTEASHTVMEIQLPTGVNAVQEDLDQLQDGLETFISNYEIDGDKVIIQLDSVPSAEPYCVGFRIQELFVTGLASSSLYKVYEYHSPDRSCSQVYYPQEHKLLRLCENEQCHCMAAECCTFRSSVDTSFTADSLKNRMCKDSVKYAFKVNVESSEDEGDFVTYKAKVQGIYIKGSEDIKSGSEVELVKKSTCKSTQLEAGQEYLVMGTEIMQIRQYRSYKYKYPLDSQAQVDVWPQGATCKGSVCTDYHRVLEDILIFGC